MVLRLSSFEIDLAIYARVTYYLAVQVLWNSDLYHFQLSSLRRRHHFLIWGDLIPPCHGAMAYCNGGLRAPPFYGGGLLGVL